MYVQLLEVLDLKDRYFQHFGHSELAKEESDSDKTGVSKPWEEGYIIAVEPLEKVAENPENVNKSSQHYI